MLPSSFLAELATADDALPLASVAGADAILRAIGCREARRGARMSVLDAFKLEVRLRVAPRPARRVSGRVDIVRAWKNGRGVEFRPKRLARESS